MNEEHRPLKPNMAHKNVRITLFKQTFKKAIVFSISIALILLALVAPQGNLKNLMIALSAAIVFVSLIRGNIFNKLMHLSVPWFSPFGIVFTIGMAAFVYWNETSIVKLQQIMADFPALSFPAQIYLWFGGSHLLSYAAHGLLFVILWHRWKRFLPALLITWLEIGLSEFGFALSQWYMFGFIFTWTWAWYISFAMICLPYITLHEYFDLSDKRLWFIFFFGIFLVFLVGFFGWRDPYTWDSEVNAFRFYPEFVYEPSSWYTMYIVRVSKILMTFAFVFVKLKNGSDLNDEKNRANIT